MKIYQFSDYRHYIRFYVDSKSESTHGMMTAIAKTIAVSRPFLSQVMAGSKNLSHEHAYALSQFFKFDFYETRYLYELVSLSRAATPEYKKAIILEMKRIKDEALSVRGDLKDEQPLDERNQAIFYSTWQYSAVHLMSGLEGGRTAEQISERLEISLSAVKANLRFLVETGLCETDGLKYFSGKRRTHLSKKSAFNSRYQTNWRLKAIEHLSRDAENDLFYTASVRIDEKGYLKIMHSLKELIREVSVTIDESDDTTLACLNLDWFTF